MNFVGEWFEKRRAAKRAKRKEREALIILALAENGELTALSLANAIGAKPGSLYGYLYDLEARVKIQRKIGPPIPGRTAKTYYSVVSWDESRE
jgi:predicted ArsR family transcriptional regulator